METETGSVQYPPQSATAMLHTLSVAARFTLVAAVLLGCNASNPDRQEAAVTVQPNVIIVLADQWRAQATGYAGNPDVQTPHLDALASESVVFNTAVAVLPVCAPFRASLLTGQYPLTHGVFYNDKPLRNEALTMAEIYKEAGYQTGYIGKWHLNGHARGEEFHAARNRPVPKGRRQGFDYWKVREVTHDYNNSSYFDENNAQHTWPGYDAFAQTDSAIAYVRRVKDQPFVLVLSWGSPHAPYHTAPAEYQERYDPATIRVNPNVPEVLRDSAQQMLAGYYAHCTALDQAMANLLAALDEEKLTENTILVFTSDHGDMLLSQGMMKKQRPWDESLRVPMLLRYPAQVSPQKINQPINTPDILPTLLGLSNLAVPESVEGTDLSQALTGTVPYPEEAALVQAPVPFHQWSFQQGGKEYRAIRTERYTYARDLTGPWLLYDDQQDPYQMNNLVNNSAHATVQGELDQMLQQKLDAVHDAFLPADEYMKQWNYRYDLEDSLRPTDYYTALPNRH